MLSSLYKLKKTLSKDRILFCFSGPTTHDILISIGDTLKKRMGREAVKSSTVNKVFSVFVEQVENIVRYSDEKVRYGDNPEGVSYGIVAVGKEDNKYYVSCGNMVKTSKTDSIKNKITYIQKLDKKQLKKYYKEKRRKGSDEDSKGAGIGLIEIARRATEKIEFHINQVDDQYSFFSIKAVI